MLADLIDKTKDTKSPIWKWILGVLISIFVFFAAWMLKRKYDELMRLRAEKRLSEERQKDMEELVKNEENKKLAQALQEEADRLKVEIRKRKEEIAAKERAYAEAKKRINAAKNWRELEQEARGTDS